MARKPGPLHSLTPSTYDNDGFFTSDGTIVNVSNDEVLRCTGLVSASSIVRRRRLGLFGHVAFGPVARLKMVSGRLWTGDVLEVDLSPPGFLRSAGTREFR